MQKPFNPQMADLGPFYQLCWLGLLTTFANLMYLIWLVSMSEGRPTTAASLVGALVTFLVLWRVLHTRQRNQQRERVARGVLTARPRLQQKLDALGDKLRKFSGDDSARLVLIPESAVVLSTLRSERAPVVEMTAGFLNTYSSNPHLIEAALAHEAGHIAARDVERFLRMLSLIRALAWFILPVLVFCGVIDARGLIAEPLHVMTLLSYLLGRTLLLALMLALAWSALLVAREVQADAFAVKVLGERRPVEDLLKNQLALRAAQARQRAPLQRLRTWLLQPDLRWRSTLPYLHGGRLGPRVEVKLGLATAAFVATVWSSRPWIESAVPIPGVLIYLGATAWGSWMTYRFFWARSRALGCTDPGTLSTGLRSVLYFCLAGTTVLLADLYLRAIGVPRQQLLESTWYGLVHVLSLSAAAVFCWAGGKLALASARERRRARPSIPRGVLSLLGILVLGAWFLVLSTTFVNGLLNGHSPVFTGIMIYFHGSLVLLAASLGAGVLAHRLSAFIQTSGGGTRRASPLDRDPRLTEPVLRRLVWTLAGLSLLVLVTCGVLLWARGAVPASGAVFFLVRFLVLALGLALAWRALLATRRDRLGWRVEVMAGLAMATFVSTVWWSVSFVLITRLAGIALLLVPLVGISAWGLWMTYRFFWARNRAQEAGHTGPPSSGLTRLLCFCLPGMVFLGADFFFLLFMFGKELGLQETELSVRPALLLSTTLVPSALAALAWASGKMALVIPREQERARPSLPRAVLSCLGILVVGVGFVLPSTIVAIGQLSSPSLITLVWVLPPLATSLAAGMLAHRLSVLAAPETKTARGALSPPPRRRELRA